MGQALKAIVFYKDLSMYIMLILFFQISFATQTYANKQKLYFLTEEYPPLNMIGKNGEITGYATEILRYSAKKAGIEINIKILPWKRAYKNALNNPNSCVYSTWRTQEREKLFLWVGPLATDAWSFFAKTDLALEVFNEDKIFDHSIASVSGWAFTKYLEKLNHPDLDSSASDDYSNAIKLLKMRVDLWAIGRITANQIIKDHNYKNIHEVFSIKNIDLSIACNLQSNVNLIHKLQEQINIMEEDGTSEKIRSKF